MVSEWVGYLSLILVLAAVFLYMQSIRSIKQVREGAPRDPLIALYMGDYSGVLTMIRGEVKGGGFRARLLLRSIDKAVARGAGEREFMTLYRKYLKLRSVSGER